MFEGDWLFPLSVKFFFLLLFFVSIFFSFALSQNTRSIRRELWRLPSFDGVSPMTSYSLSRRKGKKWYFSDTQSRIMPSSLRSHTLHGEQQIDKTIDAEEHVLQVLFIIIIILSPE